MNHPANFGSNLSKCLEKRLYTSFYPSPPKIYIYSIYMSNLEAGLVDSGGDSKKTFD